MIIGIGILVLILLVSAGMTIAAIPSTGIFWGIFLVLAGGCVLAVYLIEKKKYSYSAYEEKRMAAARAQDRSNEQMNNTRDQAAAAAHRERTNRYISELQDNRNALQAKKAALEKEIAGMDLLVKEDKNLDLVEYVVHAMESNRAETLSEALRQYDAYRADRNKDIMNQFQRKLDEQERRRKAQEDWNRHMENLAHQQRMESLERQKLEELERIRKDNEYYMRYGKPN